MATVQPRQLAGGGPQKKKRRALADKDLLFLSNTLSFTKGFQGLCLL